MTDYKLIVVSPFADYQRGDVITDAETIKNILDVDHQMHFHDAHVRRVALTDNEKQSFQAVKDDKTLEISSINADALDESNDKISKDE